MTFGWLYFLYLAKSHIFISKTGTKKTCFITMITTFGVTENGHYLSSAQNQLKMDILFER